MLCVGSVVFLFLKNTVYRLLARAQHDIILEEPRGNSMMEEYDIQNLNPRKNPYAI